MPGENFLGGNFPGGVSWVGISRVKILPGEFS